MRMKIGTKLMSSFLFVLLITAAIGILGLREQSMLNSDGLEISQVRMENSRIIGKLNGAIADYRIYLIAYVFADFRNDQAAMAAYEPKVTENGKVCEEELSNLAAKATSDTDKELINQMKTAWTELENIDKQVLDLVKSGKKAEAVALLHGESRAKYDQADIFLTKYTEDNEKDTDAIIADNQASYQSGRNISIGLIVFGVVSGLGLALSISRSITQSVQKVAEAAIRMGDGDLTLQKLDIRSKDEIGDMGKAFNQMLDNLRTLITQAGSSTQQVAATSEELTATSEENSAAAQQIAKAVDELAGGAAEQTRIVSQAVGVVEQLGQSISSIASGAQEQAASMTVTSEKTNSVVKRIQDVAARSGQIDQATEQNYLAAKKGELAVQRSIEGLNSIQSAVSDTAEKISELGKQSQQIGEIVEVIDDIAEQTNLLALNAAIEAARAGEQGKGFAVVADEVRKLAERSGKATKEIAALIASIQSGTGKAVNSMALGTQEVDRGVSVVNEAGEALGAILRVVEKVRTEVGAVVQAVDQIANDIDEVSKATETVAAISEQNTAATQEMAAGSDEVSASIANIAAIAQESAAATEEVSASTEEMNASTEQIAASAQALSMMAQQLQEVISRFKV